MQHEVGLPLRAGLSLAVLVAFCLLWQVGVEAGWAPRGLLSTPLGVLREIGALITRGDLATHVLATLARLVAGMALAILVALPLGIAVGRSPLLRALLSPGLSTGHFLPTTALIPLVLVWNDTGDAGRIALVAISAFFQLVLVIAPPVYAAGLAWTDTARLQGVQKGQMLSQVLLPAATPQIAEGLRHVLIRAWAVVIAAEFFGAGNGMGRLLMEPGSAAGPAADHALAVALVLTVMVAVVDRGFKWLNRSLFSWALA